MKTSTTGPFGTFVIALGMTLISAGFIYLKSWPDYIMAKESKAWPTTSGQILSSEIATTSNDKNEKSYRADISFSYHISSKIYQSSEVSIGSSSMYTSDSSDAYEVKNRYPVGKAVSVYYSPANPGKAVLEPGVNSSILIFLIANLIFLAVGVSLLVSSLLKVAMFSAMAAVVLASFFGKKEKKVRTKSPPPAPLKPSGADIDLDEEMVQTNKVAGTSHTPYKEPWTSEWIIKGSKKEYGPYSLKQLEGYLAEGKIKGEHLCYPVKGGSAVRISDILIKKAS